MTPPARLGAPKAAAGRPVAGSRPVVLITASPLPDGDASATRQWNLARSAAGIGGTPILVHDHPDSRGDDDRRTIDGAQLITLGGQGGGRLRRLLSRQTRAFRAVRALRQHGLGRDDISTVVLPMNVMTIGSWAVFRALLRCQVVVDVTERHDPQQFPRGRLTPYFVRHRWSTLLTRLLVHRVTTASTSLAATMRRSGLDALTVPAPLDCRDFAPHHRPPLTQGLRLIYAGTPGRKDLLNVVVAGIGTLPPVDQRRIHLTIAGISGADALNSDLSPLTLAGIEADITFLGRVPRRTVLDLLAGSHFSVLVRPDDGYATHGFPSKVPESLAAGCPVLLNHTSDLPQYVRDGIEGLILDGCGESAVSRGLARALQVSDDQWVAMSRAARSRAWQSFDYRSWRDPVATFLRFPGSSGQHSDGYIVLSPSHVK
ncbi:glycosyltransferase family 4 protein [Nakamurella sp.]|uniref:glycosyltransferase family 4 protein n=1 Tax=Nakamurella sp. TaxID=1869182 RepID=UPI003B3A311B